MMVVGSWSTRYLRRTEAIDRREKDELDPLLADTQAKEILVARRRAHNAACGMPADLTDEEVAAAESVMTRQLKGLSSLREVPSYGPSFISLWADATAKGLSAEEAADRILDWTYYWPPAWTRDYERKKKMLPKIDEAMQVRLLQSVAWRPTGDLFIPWSSEMDGQRWEVRINDFPDEYMYSLLIDGTLAGDFHDWPDAWNRGGAKVERPAVTLAKPHLTFDAAVLVDTTNLVARYRAGECEAVWRDLVALGPDVRKPPYDVPTEAVARETIRRAKHNFELIVQRLHSLDYQFLRDTWDQPATKKDLQDLAAYEEAGLLVPAAVRVFIEEMNIVWLMGTHPLLCPEGRVQAADPLFLMPLLNSGLLELWGNGEKPDVVNENREMFQLDLCAAPMSKAEVMNNAVAEDWFSIQLPDAAADAVLVGEPQGRTFVEYLRWSFKWGGFPGWEKEKSRPEKELAFLRDGLLPF